MPRCQRSWPHHAPRCRLAGSPCGADGVGCFCISGTHVPGRPQRLPPSVASASPRAPPCARCIELAGCAHCRLGQTSKGVNLCVLQAGQGCELVRVFREETLDDSWTHECPAEDADARATGSIAPRCRHWITETIFAAGCERRTSATVPSSRRCRYHAVGARQPVGRPGADTGQTQT